MPLDHIAESMIRDAIFRNENDSQYEQPKFKNGTRYYLQTWIHHTQGSRHNPPAISNINLLITSCEYFYNLPLGCFNLPMTSAFLEFIYINLYHQTAICGQW